MTEKEILSYTSNYLEINHGGNWKLEITSSNFFWNDDIPLKEVIVRSDLGHDGYLLVSTSKKVPFLITKAFHSDTLTNLLLKKSSILLDGIDMTKEFVNSLKFYYDPPFNFMIKDESGLFIDINDNFILQNIDASFYLNIPNNNKEDIDKEWLELENKSNKNRINEIMHRSGPRYNQTYNSNCVISGCTPVGWACYAGWLKMSGLLPTLFTGNSDWPNDWPTYIFKCDTASEQSKAVHELIWWFNNIMGTVDGGTLTTNIIRGGAVFAKFGNSNIQVREFRNCTIETVTQLLSNYAILFGGFRDWQKSNFISTELQRKYDTDAGHTVVCHGVRGSEIYVNMGWGGYVESRWYNINSINNRHCFGLYS